MGKDTKSWNPFVGCQFDCIYCKDSYKKLLIWNGRLINCTSCVSYSPHEHPERLDRMPSDKTIFVCSNGDVSFCDPDFMRRIIETMKNNNKENRTYLLQSKNPNVFKDLLEVLPENVVLMTTIESNRTFPISKAPSTSQRCEDFLGLNWKRKALVMEPILDFDLKVILDWAKMLSPEAIFIGFESKRKCNLVEPSLQKVTDLHRELRKVGFKTFDKSEFKYRDVF
jgi:hypothetical protein